MADNPPLSDDDVYQLLHEARLLFTNRTVATPLGRDVIKLALRDIDLIQMAMVAMQDSAREKPE